MKQFILQILIILSFIVLITPFEEMKCKLISRSFEKCSYKTKSSCCHLHPNCEMLDEKRTCVISINFLMIKLKNQIRKALQKEAEEESKNEYFN